MNTTAHAREAEFGEIYCACARKAEFGEGRGFKINKLLKQAWHIVNIVRVLLTSSSSCLSLQVVMAFFKNLFNSGGDPKQDYTARIPDKLAPQHFKVHEVHFLS